MILKSLRLELVPTTLDDLDDWFALDAQPGVLTHLGNQVPTWDGVRRDLEQRLRTARLHHGFGWFSIRQAGRFIGRCSIRPDHDGDIFNPEIGYRLHPDVWGRGFAREAAATLVEYGFRELGVTSVVAVTKPQNIASWKVMQAIGMQQERSSDEGVFYRVNLFAWLDAHPDPRAQLHDLQAAALAARDADQLGQLRAVGMRLAALEVPKGQVRVSDDLLRQIAADAGVMLR